MVGSDIVRTASYAVHVALTELSVQVETGTEAAIATMDALLWATADMVVTAGGAWGCWGWAWGKAIYQKRAALIKH